MPALFAYLLKLSCSLAVVYLFYQLVLRRLTFYNANRWYLLGYSLLSFFIPLVNISGLIEQHQLTHSAVILAIPTIETYTHNSRSLVQTNAAASLTLWDYSLAFLITGIVVLLIRLLVQYVSYCILRKQAHLISDNGIAIYQVSKSIIPFSFGNSIFINQGQHSEAELKEIIRHEFVHVAQRHTVDIICAEIVCILNWYDPFAWLLRHAVRQNLEFIADSNVIESGVDKRAYQYLLLKVIGLPQFSIAAPFNFSSLKKRIVMMNTLKSAKPHLVKFLFILPFIAVLLVAFRSGQVHKNKKRYAAVVVNDTVPPSPSPPVVAPYVSAAPNVAPDAAVTPEPVVGIGVDGDTSLLPDDYKSFLMRNPSVKNLYWSGHTVTIQLKSGKKEIYQRNNEKSMDAAERKWGKLPVAPPPPPPPPMVAPPAPPIADTTNLPNEPNDANNAYNEKLEYLKEEMAQLDKMRQNGNKTAQAQALKLQLRNELLAMQRQQTDMQKYMQEKQNYLHNEQERLLHINSPYFDIQGLTVAQQKRLQDSLQQAWKQKQIFTQAQAAQHLEQLQAYQKDLWIRKQQMQEKLQRQQEEIQMRLQKQLEIDKQNTEPTHK